MTNGDENILREIFFLRKMYEIILRNSPSSSFSRLCRIISCLAMIFLRKIRGKGRSLAKELVVNLFLDRLSEGDWNRRAASPLLTLIEFRVERARIIRATLPCTCINYYLVTWYLLLNRLPDTWHAFKQLTRPLRNLWTRATRRTLFPRENGLTLWWLSIHQSSSITREIGSIRTATIFIYVRFSLNIASRNYKFLSCV